MRGFFGYIYLSMYLYARGDHGDEDGSDNAQLTPEDERILRIIAGLLHVDYDKLVQVCFNKARLFNILYIVGKNNFSDIILVVFPIL